MEKKVKRKQHGRKLIESVMGNGADGWIRTIRIKRYPCIFYAKERNKNKSYSYELAVKLIL